MTNTLDILFDPFTSPSAAQRSQANSPSTNAAAASVVVTVVEQQQQQQQQQRLTPIFSQQQQHPSIVKVTPATNPYSKMKRLSASSSQQMQAVASTASTAAPHSQSTAITSKQSYATPLLVTKKRAAATATLDDAWDTYHRQNCHYRQPTDTFGNDYCYNGGGGRSGSTSAAQSKCAMHPTDAATTANRTQQGTLPTAGTTISVSRFSAPSSQQEQYDTTVLNSYLTAINQHSQHQPAHAQSARQPLTTYYDNSQQIGRLNPYKVTSSTSAPVVVHIDATMPYANQDTTTTQSSSATESELPAKLGSFEFLQQFNPYKTSPTTTVASTNAPVDATVHANQDATTTQSNEATEHDELPEKLGSFERFYGALLRSPLESYRNDDTSEQKKNLATICQRIGLQAPTKPLRSLYSTSLEHFQIRAALVLEEARATIGQGLQFTTTEATTTKASGFVVAVRAVKIRDSGHTALTVQRTGGGDFSKFELSLLCVGSVLLVNEEVLACVLNSTQEMLLRDKTFTILDFQTDNTMFHVGMTLQVNPLQRCLLVSTYRQFAAMTDPQLLQLPFLETLLGTKPTVNLLAADSEPQIKEATLNEMQEKAARSFLNAPAGSITIVQGYACCWLMLERP
jgi:hypothetical protein